MNWDLRIESDVKKFLKYIPKKDAERIDAVLEDFVFNPYAGDIEKMRGEENAWRRRVGACRILYEILTKQKIIHVVEVRRRTSKTY